MALRFMDSFDVYASADILKKWTISQGTAMTINATTGRRGGSSLRLTGASNPGRLLSKTLDNQASWTLGMAFRYNSSIAALTEIVAFLDNGAQQVSIQLGASGTLTAMRSTGTSLGATTFALAMGTYYYLEIQVVIHNTTGSVLIHVDGAAVLTLTNVNTRATANATANQVGIGANAAFNSYSMDFDDFYICDGTGSAPHNTFLGDCKVDAMLTNGDTATNQWTCSTGTVHYDLCNDPTPNTTDYVSSSTVGQRDVFQMQNVATTPSLIYGMQVSAAALKSDAGARSLKVMVSSNAVDAASPAFPLSTSQTYVHHIFLVDPNTSLPWTPLAVNSALGAVECA